MNDTKIKEPTCQLIYRRADVSGKCFVMVSQWQAELLLEILSQDESRIRQIVGPLKGTLLELREKKGGMPGINDCISISVKSKTGIVAAQHRPLYWRICAWLLLICAYEDQSNVERICTQLTSFIAGGDVKTISNEIIPLITPFNLG